MSSQSVSSRGGDGASLKAGGVGGQAASNALSIIFVEAICRYVYLHLKKSRSVEWLTFMNLSERELNNRVDLKMERN